MRRRLANGLKDHYSMELERLHGWRGAKEARLRFKRMGAAFGTKTKATGDTDAASWSRRGIYRVAETTRRTSIWVTTLWRQASRLTTAARQLHQSRVTAAMLHAAEDETTRRQSRPQRPMLGRAELWRWYQATGRNYGQFLDDHGGPR